MWAWAAKTLRMPSIPPTHPLVAIIGATGTGKSELAVRLAQRFNGEIINGDALQMYEGLPIITNKMPLAERRGIPHHLLDSIKSDEEPWTVTKFVHQASKVIEELRSRGKLPILVGGTHYYTQSLLFGNSTVGDDTALATFEEQAQKWPILDSDTQEMLEELRRLDPAMANRWHPNDRRKIRRSLEIVLTTGRRASDVYQLQQSMRAEKEGGDSDGDVYDASDLTPSDPHHGSDQGPALRYDSMILWTHASSEVLNERLEHRVDQMVSCGLLEEVTLTYRSFQKSNSSGTPDLSRGIWVAIGFKELWPFVTDPDGTTELRDEGIERTKIATRQYAKRQTRWIRLKLQRALYAAGAQGRMFLVDATDLTKWSEEVEGKASHITSYFLRGDVLPDPSLMSDMARVMLVNTAAESKSGRFCEACRKTLMSQSEWVGHLKSKGHKAATRPRIDWKALYPLKDNG